MNFLGLNTFDIVVTIVLLLMLCVGLIGLKIRREQLSLGPERSERKRKAIERRSESKRIKQEEDELAALMFNSDESYDD